MSEETASVQQQAADVPAEAEGFSEKEKAANRTGAEKRDWVDEAYKCFIKDAKDMDPTDPVTAIEIYFERHATRELLARCKAEGKDAKGCWEFIEAVARKALGGRNGHIDPAVVYAIAMHWFEDVPKDWYGQTGKVSHAPRASAKTEKAKKPKKPAETPSEIKKEKAKAKKAAKPKQEQGFFFDLLETPQESEAKE